HDHALRALVVARLVPLGVLTPWAHRIPFGTRLAFASTVRMVDGVHRHAAHRGPDAAPALPAGFTNGFQIVLLISHFTDRGSTVHMHAADLAGAKTQLSIGAFARQQLHGSTRRARPPRALFPGDLHAMDRGAHGDIAQRQGIAGFDRRIRAAHELLARAQP